MPDTTVAHQWRNYQVLGVQLIGAPSFFFFFWWWGGGSGPSADISNINFTTSVIVELYTNKIIIDFSAVKTRRVNLCWIL